MRGRAELLRGTQDRPATVSKLRAVRLGSGYRRGTLLRDAVCAAAQSCCAEPRTAQILIRSYEPSD